MRPDNLISRGIKKTRIGNIVFSEIEINLNHINFGLDLKTKELNKKKRSNFSADDVALIFESLDGQKTDFEQDGDWNYFSLELRSPFNHRWYKIVCCFENDKAFICGIITLYKDKGKKS